MTPSAWTNLPILVFEDTLDVLIIENLGAGGWFVLAEIIPELLRMSLSGELFPYAIRYARACIEPEYAGIWKVFIDLVDDIEPVTRALS